MVDLTGHTAGSRLEILASRPAPVQLHYIGHPGTLGVDFIDYLIVDPFVVPPDERQHYSEALVTLSQCYQANDRKRAASDRQPSRAEAGLPPDGFVFCCFNQSYKITPALFGVWMRLLDAVPGSVLWLLADNRWAEDNLRREAAARGVAPERLVFAPRLAAPEHLARHALADLFLDTFPYNAHTTASDALWMGLPVLTLAGRGFASRVAGSLLHAVGLAELITYDLAEYERLALALVGEPVRLAAIRGRLEVAHANAPLFDLDRTRREIEAAYQQMWEIAQRGEAPRSFGL
jgi:predicted O-linked N-acetylglucosamine transferase (SPINDLY family)